MARLGWVSDTGDRDGELVHTGRLPERLAIPIGEQQQRPPAYSAVKVKGERAYELARRGEEVELEPRPVTVHRAELLWREADRAAFEIECSTGTYVRTLIADLGDAYCEELERTAIGPFRLEHAKDEDTRCPSETRWRFCPSGASKRARPVRSAMAGAIARGSAADGPVRLQADEWPDRDRRVAR